MCRGKGSIGMAVHCRRRGGYPTPPNKVTIAGKNETDHRENLVRLFVVHKLLGPKPPSPLPPF